MTATHPRRRRHRASSDERGAIFVSTVIMMAGILILSAFVIDLGTGRIARRDLQTMADVAALDVGRVIDGTSTASALSSAAQSSLNASLARNRSGIIRTSSTTSSYQFGLTSEQGKWLSDCTGTCVPTAVRVSVGGEVSMRFWPGDSIAPTQTAMAAQQPKSACITIGSFLAALNTNNGGVLVSLLNNIVGANATVFSSEGLVAVKNVGIPLLDLTTALGIAGASDPLTAEVSLAEVARAAASVLSKRSDSASTNAAVALTNIANASIQNNFTSKIKLGDIIDLGVGNSAAVLAGNINVFDLITAQMFVFDGQRVLNVPTTALTLPAGLAIASVEARVINPPTIVCGRAGTVATNSQIELTVKGEIGRFKCSTLLGLTPCAVNDLLNALLGGLLNGLLGGWSAESNLLKFTLTLNAVNATAKIDSITSCEPSPRVDVTVSTSAASGNLTIKLLNAVQANVAIPGALGEPGQTHTFTSSPATWVSAGGVGANGSLIGPITINTPSLQLPTGSVLSGVTIPGLSIGSTLSTVLNNLLAQLGITLNGANLTLSQMDGCKNLALRE